MQYISSFLEIVLESDVETGFTPDTKLVIRVK
jgi:hypothetical protein